MNYSYLNFVSDEHLLSCIDQLYKSYIKAKNNITKNSFYLNKVDIIKLTFDSKFNNLDQESLIQAEILRQIDKSINNSIGIFHEKLLSGIDGYEGGYLKGFDIKSKNDTLFADIKNKHNTMNSSAAEALFQKLSNIANNYKKAKCYWVQILAKKSFSELWRGEINGKEYNHSRVYKISGDQFYALLSGEKDALSQLYKILPDVIENYLNTNEHLSGTMSNSVLDEIKTITQETKRSILDQISFDNYFYYSGFNDL